MLHLARSSWHHFKGPSRTQSANQISYTAQEGGLVRFGERGGIRKTSHCGGETTEEGGGEENKPVLKFNFHLSQRALLNRTWYHRTVLGDLPADCSAREQPGYWSRSVYLVMPHQISGCCTLSRPWSNAISVCISAASVLQQTREGRGGWGSWAGWWHPFSRAGWHPFFLRRKLCHSKLHLISHWYEGGCSGIHLHMPLHPSST